ncbi:MAG: hypothetical protein H6728_05555 [Myxococcales bacterium]|nr:hypothetical protein [Myxococcales bacterium]
MRNKRADVVCWLCGLLVFGLWSMAPVWAEVVKASDILRCSGMIKSQGYLFAATCFRELAESLPDGKDLSEEDRRQRGYLYNEASKCMRFEAMREKRPEVAAYLREQALRWLELILKKQWLPLVRGKRRSRVYTEQIVALRTKIHYTPMAISTGVTGTQIQITGYQFRQQAMGQWNDTLRPGEYTITVRYPKEEKPREKKLTLRPGVSLVLTFQQKPPLSGLLLSGYIVGGIAVAAGGVLLGVGLARISAGNTCFSDAECVFYQGAILQRSELPKDVGAIDNKSEFQSYNNVSMGLTIAGIALAVVGVGALVTSGIFHARLVKEDFRKKEQILPSGGASSSRTLLWGTP